MWYRLRQQRAPASRLVGMAGLVFVLSASPWFVRNYLVFHQVIPFRSNFGLELRLGNYPSGMGVRAVSLHPSQNDEELEKYRRMGELAYIAEKKGEVLQSIRQNPGAFAKHTVLRFLMWWTGEEWKIHGTRPLDYWITGIQIFGFGAESFLAFLGLFLALGRGRRDAMPYAIFLLVYPLVYYVTFPELRFRHPLEPMMLVLCVYALRRAFYGERAEQPAAAPASAA